MIDYLSLNDADLHRDNVKEKQRATLKQKISMNWKIKAQRLISNGESSLCPQTKSYWIK